MRAKKKQNPRKRPSSYNHKNQPQKQRVKPEGVLIGIVPLGRVEDADVEIVESCLRSYGLATKRLPVVEPPPWLKLHRGRMHANEVAGWLKRFRRDEITHVLGLTMVKQHSCKEIVLGLALEQTCVVSKAELKTKYGLRSLVMHEVGHLFSLDHCPDETCLMSNETSPDWIGDYFCASCLGKYLSQKERLHPKKCEGMMPPRNPRTYVHLLVVALLLMIFLLGVLVVQVQMKTL